MTLDAAAREVLACVADGLDVPACVQGATPGTPAIDYCCAADGGECVGQLTVHVVGMFDVDGATGVRTSPRSRPCRPGRVGAQVQVTLARCTPTVNDRGDPPAPEVLDGYATATALDVQQVWAALACCPVTTAITSVDVQSPPSGGCVVIVANVTVEVTMDAVDG